MLGKTVSLSKGDAVGTGETASFLRFSLDYVYQYTIFMIDAYSGYPPRRLTSEDMPPNNYH